MTKKVLVVDDEDHIREVAQMSLEEVGGWAVFTASSGPEAQRIAREEKPDAILLDVMMPEMDGPATFAALRADEETKSIPVVLLTAKVQSADRTRFVELGVDGVLSKPFDPMTLPAEIARMLGWAD